MDERKASLASFGLTRRVHVCILLHVPQFYYKADGFARRVYLHKTLSKAWISTAISKRCTLKSPQYHQHITSTQPPYWSSPLTCLRYSIENPLNHLTPDELEKDARTFARTTGLEQYQDLMERGAKLAKDPQYFEVIPGVTDDEKQALRDERRRRFRQPRQLYLTIIICSIGAAVQYVHLSVHAKDD